MDIKKGVLLFTLFSICFAAGAQFWLRKGTGSQQNEANDIAVDNNGNTFTTGHFYLSITFGGFTVNSSGLTDIYLVKTDSSGNFQWLISAGGSGLDRGTAVKTDNAGNVYLTGVFSGSADFSGTTLVSNSGSQDVFIAKYNSSGILQWVKRAGGPAGDASNSITTDNFGNVLITGYFENQADFDATTITSTLNASNQYTADVFTAKYDNNGNLKWVKQGATIEFASGTDVASDANGNHYITGAFSGNITFDNFHANNSFNSIFIVKYDSTGAEQWYRRIGAGTTNSVAGIVADNLSNIYMTGNFTGSTIVFGTPNVTLTNNYPERIFLLKYNSAGSLLWHQTVGSVNEVSVKKIAVDNLNAPYVTGSFKCVLSEYADQYGQGTFNSVGFKDIFVTKHDTTGNWLWSRQFGGQKDDQPAGIEFGPDNNAVITGTFSTSVIFPVNPNNFSSPVGDFTPGSVNQGLSYCGDSHYGTFTGLLGSGVMDVFIAKAIDLSRQPFDFYKRSGTSCIRDVGNICISIDDTICAPDTILINTCNLNNTTDLYSLSNISPGPGFNYFWSWNFLNSVQPDITLSNYTGPVSLTMTTDDGCFVFNDHDYMITNVLPTPQFPPVSDNLGFNNNTATPVTIVVCPPDTQVIITGTNTGAYYYWLGYSPGASPLSITVTTSSDQYFCVGTIDSCEVCTKVIIEFPNVLLPLVPVIAAPDTVKGCAELFVTFMAFNSLLVDTFCIFPPASTTWSVNLPVSWYPQTCTSDGIFSATQTGLHQITGTIIRNNQCGIADTHYISFNVYVEIYPNPPPINVNISGSNLLCQSGTTTLTATGTPPGTTYEWYNLFNGALIGTSQTLTVSQPGDYYVIAYYSNSFGCYSTSSAITTVIPKPVPPILMNPSSGVICPGGSVLLVIPSSSGTFQWFGPSGAIPGNTNNITVNTPGNYFAIYTDTDSCEFILNTVEVQQYATPYLSAGPSTVICPGESVTLQINSNAGSNIQWQPPLSGNNTTQVITQPGTYSVVINSCGIQTTDSVVISASNVDATITPSGTLSVCVGDSLLLSGPPGMASYTWLPVNVNTQTFYVSQSGIYQLVVSDSACTDTSSVEVFTYFLDPPFAFDETICADSVAVLTGFYTSGTLGWYDAPNGNLLDTGATFTTPALQSNTLFYMQVIDGNCISTFEPVTVFIAPSLPAPNVFSNSPVCVGDDVLLNTNFLGSNPEYTWTGPNNFASTIQNPVINNATASNSGTYQLVVADGGCPSEAATINVLVVNVPQLPQLTANNPICEGNTIIITADTIAGANYSWNGPNNFTSSNQNVIINSSGTINSGIYSLVISSGSCVSDTAFISIVVNANPVAVNANVNSPVCSGDSIILSADYFNNYNYMWSGPGNWTASGNQVIIYPASQLNSGNYILTVETNGCTSLPETLLVNIYQPSTFTLGDDKTICTGESLTLAPDQSFNSYLWNTGSTNMNLTVNTAGTYYLIIYDNNNCRSSDTIDVNLIDCFTEIPNVFTPNNDGLNDHFTLNFSGAVELTCRIYNRWGDLIYEFNHLKNSWDGTHQSTGKECNDGVYFYVISFTDISFNNKEITGFVHLRRN